MADSLSLRQRATIHTSYWSWCLAALLHSCPKEQRLARPISLHSATSTKSHRGVLVPPIQSKRCVTQVGSTVVCSSYIFSLLLKLVLQPKGPERLSHSSYPFLFPRKKRAVRAVSTEVLISLRFLSLPFPPFLSVLAKQSGLAPKHNYENGPLGCFF